MVDLCIDDKVAFDLLEAVRIYRDYFAKHGDPVKGEVWADEFIQAYLEFLAVVSERPEAFPRCGTFPFDTVDVEHRACSVGWFTVLYTVEEEKVCVWHVANARSDFRRLKAR